MTHPRHPALLVLEDGTALPGRGLGERGEAFGEAVFNTAMAGYQEILTDPSYRNQIVVMTAPHQGNYGVNPDDAESGRTQAAGFVVREASDRPSSWRATGSLSEYLASSGVVGIDDVDTRLLTLRIRRGGAMRAAVSTIDLDPRSLLRRVRASAGMEGADLASAVSCSGPYRAADQGFRPSTTAGGTFRVAAYDFGIKRNILRRLAENGCDTTIFPATTTATAILAEGFDGVFLSNGPGDPAATAYGIRATRDLLGKVPVFGICLGHQLMALALGGRTYKLKFGHRGANQPVKDVESGRIHITSHNHGFAVDADGWGPSTPSGADVQTPLGRARLTHWNLNDHTLEGLRCLDVPAFSVQYHPEASPGPHDARHLFERFRELMA